MVAEEEKEETKGKEEGEAGKEEKPEAEEKVEKKEEPQEEEKPKAKERVKEEAKKKTKEKAKPKTGKAGVPKEDIIETVKQMSAIELAELVKELEDVFGVSAAQAVAVSGPGGAGAAAGEAAEEKSSFDVVLTASGGKKIQVIKEVRSITGLGLKEAKGLVDGAPKPVKEGLAKEEAEKIKTQLEEAGATVKLK